MISTHKIFMKIVVLIILTGLFLFGNSVQINADPSTRQDYYKYGNIAAGTTLNYTGSFIEHAESLDITFAITNPSSISANFVASFIDENGSAISIPVFAVLLTTSDFVAQGGLDTAQSTITFAAAGGRTTVWHIIVPTLLTGSQRLKSIKLYCANTSTASYTYMISFHMNKRSIQF